MEEENSDIGAGENSESSRDDKDKTGESKETSLEEASRETGKSKSKSKSKISRSKASKLS